MVKKCLFKQKIHLQVQKLRECFVISNQNAQFITDFFVLITTTLVTMLLHQPGPQLKLPS